MTEKANPSINRPAEAFKTAGAIALAGGSADGWVSESGKPTDISVEDADITNQVFRPLLKVVVQRHSM